MQSARSSINRMERKIKTKEEMIGKDCKLIQGGIGPDQTSNFTCADSKANEVEQ